MFKLSPGPRSALGAAGANKPESSCAANTRVAPSGYDPTSELEQGQCSVQYF